MSTQGRMYHAQQYTRLLGSAILVSFIYSGTVYAEEPGCIAAADVWISQISSDKSDILQRHARTRCESAGYWMSACQHQTDSSGYEQMCTDLVLIWTHKECEYFRDDVHHEAYVPCVAWSRRMFEECMAGHRAWFEPTAP